MRNQLSGNNFCRGLVVRGCGEAMGCHPGAGRSVNFVHVQYKYLLRYPVFWLAIRAVYIRTCGWYFPCVLHNRQAGPACPLGGGPRGG